MSAFKLLIVEDKPEELDLYRNTGMRYAREKGREIEFVESKTMDEANKTIDNSFDGVIIDLKLGPAGDEGNIVIQNIHDKYRIPVAILTGTPGNANPDFKDIIKVYKKGENGLDEILDDLIQIYDTGLTKIFGGRGIIENRMDKVFWDNIIPQLDSWKSHVERGENTEKALLRFIMNHLLEHLDDDSDRCLPEEMYIIPPVSSQIKTGSIVKKRDANDCYVVLSPACDLVVHDGNFKTNRILVCMIEKYNISLLLNAKRNMALEISEHEDEGTKKDKIEKKRNAENLLIQLPKNTYSGYYHYLPQTIKFEGGIIDFRKIDTYKPTDFSSKFDTPFVQISNAFTKDIVSRFSSYYARQGQPDFDFVALADKLKACISE
jgi:hypothetical protein